MDLIALLLVTTTVFAASLGGLALLNRLEEGRERSAMRARIAKVHGSEEAA